MDMRITDMLPWVVAPSTWLAAATGHAQMLHDTDLYDVGSPASSRTSGGQASLGVRVFSGTRITGKRELGGHIVVEIPFGRLLTPRPPHSIEPTIAEPPPAPKETTPAPRAPVQPSLARACVRAAWRAHGVNNLNMTDSMKSRARTSALLPDTRFRVSQDWDQSFRLSPTNDDPYRLHETNAGGRKIEGTVTWRLGQLIFAHEEIAIERLRVQQSQLRSRIAGEVLRALFDWQRARMLLADPSIDETERLDATLREAECVATLDVLTGGWFSSWLDANP